MGMLRRSSGSSGHGEILDSSHIMVLQQPETTKLGIWNMPALHQSPAAAGIQQRSTGHRWTERSAMDWKWSYQWSLKPSCLHGHEERYACRVGLILKKSGASAFFDWKPTCARSAEGQFNRCGIKKSLMTPQSTTWSFQYLTWDVHLSSHIIWPTQ